MIRTLTFALLVAAAACGGKDKAAPGTSTTTTAKSGDGDDHVHTGLPPEMNAFHERLRPLWHAEQGAKRMTDTCAAVPQFEAEANAIATATPPQAANADAWTNGTRALVSSVAALKTECATNDLAKFDAAFSKVHDAFHALMMAQKERMDTDGGVKPPEGQGSGTGKGQGPGQGSGHGHGGHDHKH